MAAKGITDALQNPHREVPFAHVEEDTILALAELATIFKLKLRQTPTPTLPAAPPTVKQRTCLAKSSNPILSSHMPLPRQTRSQTTIHTQDIINAPLLPRVVTPRTLNPSPPRVPTSCTSTAMPLTFQSHTPEAASEVCFSWATNPHNKIRLMYISSMTLPSSKT
jgi:hypothetical protein